MPENRLCVTVLTVWSGPLGPTQSNTHTLDSLISNTLKVQGRTNGPHTQTKYRDSERGRQTLKDQRASEDSDRLERRRIRRRVNAWRDRLSQLDAELAETDGLDKPTDDDMRRREHKSNVGRKAAAARWAKSNGKYRRE